MGYKIMGKIRTDDEIMERFDKMSNGAKLVAQLSAQIAQDAAKRVKEGADESFTSIGVMLQGMGAAIEIVESGSFTLAEVRVMVKEVVENVRAAMEEFDEEDGKRAERN